MDDVLTELRLATESIDRGNAAQRNFMRAVQSDSEALWNDLAELRDALLALANRVEALTRATLTPFECVPDESGGVRDADA